MVTGGWGKRINDGFVQLVLKKEIVSEVMAPDWNRKCGDAMVERQAGWIRKKD